MAKFFGECNLINCQVLDEDTNHKVKSEFGNFIIPKITTRHELEFVYGIRPEEVKLCKNENSMKLRLRI